MLLDLSSVADIPADKSASQVWILMSLHPPLEPTRRNFSFFNGLINWTSTYSDDVQVSDIRIRYGRYEVMPTDSHERKSSLPINISTVYQSLTRKRRMVAWFVTECRLPAIQVKVVQLLQQSIPVDVYGACRSLDCGNKDRCLEMLSKHYKFYLAFEKVNCRHYITDQFWYVALQHDVIPVVMGSPRADYEKVAPPHSFIHVDDFRSVDKLAKHLNRLNDDFSLYESYFKWKENGFVSLLEPWPLLSDVYLVNIHCVTFQSSYYKHHYMVMFTCCAQCSLSISVCVYLVLYLKKYADTHMHTHTHTHTEQGICSYLRVFDRMTNKCNIYSVHLRTSQLSVLYQDYIRRKFDYKGFLKCE